MLTATGHNSDDACPEADKILTTMGRDTVDIESALARASPEPVISAKPFWARMTIRNSTSNRKKRGRNHARHGKYRAELGRVGHVEGHAEAGDFDSVETQRQAFGVGRVRLRTSTTSCAGAQESGYPQRPVPLSPRRMKGATSPVIHAAEPRWTSLHRP